MIDSASEKFVSDPRQRRKEIERCLISCGIGPGPRRLFRKPADLPPDEPKISRLRRGLEQLGPVFSTFGRYLSSRVDLAPLQDCLELASIRDRGTVLTGNQLNTILTQATGNEPTSVFLHFDTEPFVSCLAYQAHQARLPDGTPVTVKVTDPSLMDHIAYDVQFFTLLQDAFNDLGWASFSLDEVIEDFLRAVHRIISRGDEADMLNILAEDTRTFDALLIPTVYETYSSPHVLIVERLPGWTIDTIVSNRTNNDADMYDHNLADPVDIARTIWYTWLRQVIHGRFYPTGLGINDITALTADRVSWSGGSFTSMPSASRENVWNYLNATASLNPDRAYDYLVEEMEEESRVRGEEGLRNRLRQVVPFRDGSWNPTGDADTLAEHLFIHWRLARDHGYQPRLHLLDFYRGLFAVTSVTQRLAPGRDTMREGLEALRMTVGMGEMRNMMNPEMWQEVMEQYAGTVIELPRKLDEVLFRVKNGDLLKQTDSSKSTGGSSVFAAITGLLCLLVANVLVSRHLMESVENPIWIERISTALFLLCGLMILIVLRKKR